jgi:oligopeptidase A
MKNNPLLSNALFPLFEHIETRHLIPALEDTLSKNRERIDTLCEAPDMPSWENFVEPLEDLNEKIEHLWSPVSHINAVKDSKALRTEVEKALPMLSAYSTEMGQNSALYGKFKDLAGAPEFSRLTQAQRTTIDNELRDFELSGVALNTRDKGRYKAINTELSKLSLQYEQNVLDATQGWALNIIERKQLAGLPEQIIDAARQCADEAKLDGWRFTLQAPSYIPFLSYTDSRELRREMYEAYATRASDQGPNAGTWDNSKTMREIVRLRQEKAALLGLSSYAEYSLKTKMAESVETVDAFLLDLARRSRTAALEEWNTLEQFAKTWMASKNYRPGTPLIIQKN